MKVKSAFGKELLKPHDLDVYEDLDVCGPIRHWFANYGLCTHLVEKIKTKIHVPGLRQVFKDHWENIPGDTPEEETTTVEDYLTLLTRTWDDIISEYELPFRAIMGEEKWLNVCERFHAASNHLRDRKEEEEK